MLTKTVVVQVKQKGCAGMKYLKAIKNFILKYKHGVILSYFFIYIIWFTYLERTVTTQFHPIYSKLDDLIPFNELFIIPYFLWFIYIFVTVAYLLFTSRRDFLKCCAYLFIGMTVCLLIYTVWPNGHYLRVDLNSLGRKNIFIDLLSKIYSIDTATNVFPSIHVFNSVGAYIAIHKNERLHKIKWLQFFTLILTVMICLSTVYLKQHSVMDIFGALTLNIVMYAIVYLPSWDKVFNTAKTAKTVKAAKSANQEFSKI
jgi:membrane-associated phospholipid phosphatase